MRRLRSMKSLLAGVAVAVILLVNIFPVVAYGAIAPWHGHTWNGKTWEGNTWRGHSWDHFKWSGPKWNGSPWDGSPGNGKSWNGNDWNGKTGDGSSWDSDTGNGNGWRGSPGNGNSWNVSPGSGKYGKPHSQPGAPWNTQAENRAVRNQENGGTNALPYFNDFKKARRWYSWGVNTGIGGLSWRLGYKVEQRDGKYIIKGARDVKGRWNKGWAGKKLGRMGAGGFSNKIGKGLHAIYHDYRGIEGNTTWYSELTDNPVQKHVHLGTAIKSSLNNGFWKKSLKLSSNLKGGGIVGRLATFGGDIWKYSPLGKKSNEGYANTDFASAIITDGGIAAGTTILSSALGSMAAGSLAGSVVPGLGTIVGAAVGLGVGIFLSTDAGRGVRNFIKGGVKTVLDGGVDLAKKGWNKTKEAASKVSNAVGDAWDWATGLF